MTDPDGKKKREFNKREYANEVVDIAEAFERWFESQNTLRKSHALPSMMLIAANHILTLSAKRPPEKRLEFITHSSHLAKTMFDDIIQVVIQAALEDKSDKSK